MHFHPGRWWVYDLGLRWRARKPSGNDETNLALEDYCRGHSGDLLSHHEINKRGSYMYMITWLFFKTYFIYSITVSNLSNSDTASTSESANCHSGHSRHRHSPGGMFSAARPSSGSQPGSSPAVGRSTIRWYHHHKYPWLYPITIIIIIINEITRHLWYDKGICSKHIVSSKSQIFALAKHQQSDRSW